MTDISPEAVHIMHKRLGSTPFPGDLQSIVDDADLMIEALFVRCVRLEWLMRSVVSHATCGTTTGEGMDLNSIGVEITRMRNRIYSDAKARGRNDALREGAAKLRKEAAYWDDKAAEAHTSKSYQIYQAKAIACAECADAILALIDGEQK